MSPRSLVCITLLSQLMTIQKKPKLYALCSTQYYKTHNVCVQFVCAISSDTCRRTYDIFKYVPNKTHTVEGACSSRPSCYLIVVGVLQHTTVCCSVLQCVAVCCSALQCVAVHCSALQHILQCVAVLAVHCSALQCVAVCCSALQCVAVRCSVLHRVSSTLRHTATHCNTLQHTATHCFNL